MARKIMFRTIGVAILAVIILPIVLISQSQQGKTVIRVDAAHPGAAISPKMFGIFFEDINFAADGGLYPERIKNRSFEFDQPLTGLACDFADQFQRHTRQHKGRTGCAQCKSAQ